MGPARYRRGKAFEYTSDERLKEAIEKKLFADLNATQTVFPGTQLTMVFKLGSA